MLEVHGLPLAMSSALRWPQLTSSTSLSEELDLTAHTDAILPILLNCLVHVPCLALPGCKQQNPAAPLGR